MPQLISCQVPMYDAVRSIGKENLILEYQETMAKWAKDAEDKINTKSWYEKKTICLYTKGSKVTLPIDFKYAENMNLNGTCVRVVNKLYNKCCTARCWNVCVGDIPVRIGQDYIQIGIDVDDNTPFHLEYLAIALDENGFPMIDQDHELAVSLYIQYKLLLLTRDLQIMPTIQNEWTRACGQARARTNERILNESAYFEIGQIYNSQPRSYIYY